jgi:glyoxylase-like metal-dependent hydrolase (beta-lactamase superfamily II)
MRVIMLQNSGLIYTSNAYLVLGNWSRLSDVNTLIDTGRDPAVLEALAQAPTGVGKKSVEQVVLTHGHYDHVEVLEAIRERFQPVVCAFRGAVERPDRVLDDGDEIPAGDGTLEVIHTSGHSSDSICLYSRREGVLFAGDAPLLVNSGDATYEDSFATALEKLCSRDVRIIYFGHGAPLVEDCDKRLRRSLELVTNSRPQVREAQQG